MIYPIATLIGFMAGAFIGSMISRSVWYKAGIAAAPRDRRLELAQSMNEFSKLISKPGAVAEFLAPGEGAEYVEIDPEAARAAAKGVWGYSGNPQHRNLHCMGCRYAGRYVVKAKETE